MGSRNGRTTCLIVSNGFHERQSLLSERDVSEHSGQPVTAFISSRAVPATKRIAKSVSLTDLCRQQVSTRATRRHQTCLPPIPYRHLILHPRPLQVLPCRPLCTVRLVSFQRLERKLSGLTLVEGIIVTMASQSILDPLDTLILGIGSVPVQLKRRQLAQMFLDSLGENVNRSRIHLSVL
jgi:hypothetical protein